MIKRKYDDSVYDPETLKNVRSQWLELLLIFSDIDFQEQYLLNKEIRNPFYSYSEIFECYSSVTWNDNYEEMIECGYYTSEEYEIIKEFHKRLWAYLPPNNDYDDREGILADPEWLEIVAFGKDRMAQLKKIITDPDELKFFDNYYPELNEGDFT